MSLPTAAATTMPFFVGVDLGTSGCRACAIDTEANLVTLQKSSFDAPIVTGHSITQDPSHWWTVTENTLLKVFSKLIRTDIASICVNGTSATTLITNQEGFPLLPARMYNDASSTTQATLVEKVAPEDSAARGATASLAKALALCEQSPSSAKYILHQADWIAGKLSGKWGISDENNALKLGFNPITRCWPNWLTQLPIAPLLPRVVAPGTAIGPLLPALAQRWQLSTQTLVVAGTTDSTAGVLAAGAQQPGAAITSLGSTIVLKLWSDTPVNAARYGVYSHRIGDRWLVGGASNSGGAVLQHYFTTAQIVQLSQQLDHAPATDLDYYPLLRPGERFPIADPQWPVRLSPRADDAGTFLLGMLEGMANIEKMGYERLAELGCPPITHVATVGGGAANPIWTKLRQSRLQVPIYNPPQTEAAYGSALLARQAFLSAQ